VIDYLHSAPTIDSHVREASLALAEHRREEIDPKSYYAAAWPVIRHPYANLAACQFARAQMAAACERAPEDAQYRLALAFAQYRLGRFQKEHYTDALATLAKCDPNQPAMLAFRAMAEHQLGRHEQARATMSRLKELTKRPPWTGDADTAVFLSEAEALFAE
jgi:Flp pilus assembly protein TadD